MELLREIERYNTIQQAMRELEKEKDLLRKKIADIVRAAGGRLIVGDFTLSLSEVSRPRFADILAALAEQHPELSEEIEKLREQFVTVYERLDIVKSN